MLPVPPGQLGQLQSLRPAHLLQLFSRLRWVRVLSVMAILVRRDSAVKLIDDLAGESPAGADCPVGTVVISGDGAGDQTVGSPDVNVLVGWMRIWSAPTGGQTKQQVAAKRT